MLPAGPARPTSPSARMDADDWAAVRRIYAEGIATGDATFETEVPDRRTLDAALAARAPLGRRARRRRSSAGPPPARSRPGPCYAGVAETSVYVGDGPPRPRRRQGTASTGRSRGRRRRPVDPAGLDLPREPGQHRPAPLRRLPHPRPARTHRPAPRRLARHRLPRTPPHRRRLIPRQSADVGGTCSAAWLRRLDRLKAGGAERPVPPAAGLSCRSPQLAALPLTRKGVRPELLGRTSLRDMDVWSRELLTGPLRASLGQRGRRQDAATATTPSPARGDRSAEGAEHVRGRAAPATELITYLDPRELIPNPRNPRTDLGDLEELTASIRQGGVLEPLIVAPSRSAGTWCCSGTAGATGASAGTGRSRQADKPGCRTPLDP